VVRLALASSFCGLAVGRRQIKLIRNSNNAPGVVYFPIVIHSIVEGFGFEASPCLIPRKGVLKTLTNW
jgi:hypothetical protein